MNRIYRAINTILTANPIALIVAGIVALVAVAVPAVLVAL